MMSLRLRVVSTISRLVFKPWAGRATDPAHVRAAFLRHARRMHLSPPHAAYGNGHLGDVPVRWVRCGPVTNGETLFYVHGGGFIVGHPDTHRHIVAELCRDLGCEAVMPVYRLAPEHPFPAGLEDVFAAYCALVDSGRDPDSIVLIGDSAGGNLVMALLQMLCERDLPMPRATVPISPVLDLTGGSDSLRENARTDAILSADRFDDLMEMYLQGHDRSDPRASPLFGNFPCLPPMLFHVCDDEILRDDTLRMQSHLIGLGHDPLVRSWPGGLHVFHLMRGWVPEADEALRDIAGFIRSLR